MPHNPNHLHDGAEGARGGDPTGQRPFSIQGRTDNRQSMYVRYKDQVGPSMVDHPTAHLSDSGFDQWSKGGYTGQGNSWKKDSYGGVVPE